MKRKLLCITVLLFLYQKIFSQSEGPLNPMSSSYSVMGCLACPGSDWQNFQNITYADHLTADVTLAAYPMCFQTTCYYSRILFGFNFGFTIPQGSVIRGVTADVLRTSTLLTGISDSLIKLYSGSPVGINHASTTWWTPNSITVSYGDSADTWGCALTPDSVNNAQFGLALMVMDKNVSATFATASVDHVQMTVYYSTSNGIASQTRSSSLINLYFDKSNSTLSIFSSTEQKINSLRIVDVMGNEIFSSQSFYFATEIKKIALPFLREGIYFAIVEEEGKTIARKFTVE